MWQTVYEQLKANGIEVKSSAQSGELCIKPYCVAAVEGYDNGFEQIAVTVYVPLEQYSSLTALCDEVVAKLKGIADLQSVSGDSLQSSIRAHSRTLCFCDTQRRYDFANADIDEIAIAVGSAYIEIDGVQHELDCRGALKYTPAIKDNPAQYVLIGSRVAAQYDPQDILLGFDITLTNVACTDGVKNMLTQSGGSLIAGEINTCALIVYEDEAKTQGMRFDGCRLDASAFELAGGIYGDLKLKCRPKMGGAAMTLL